MFYHPLFRSTTQQKISFHVSLHATHRDRKGTTQKFPNSFMVHEHKHSGSTTRTREFFLFVKHVSSTFNCVSAIFSRTENAHQRKFLMLLTIKSKYLVVLSILLYHGVKHKRINEESQVLRMS